MDYSKATDEEIAIAILCHQGFELMFSAFTYSAFIGDDKVTRKDVGFAAASNWKFDPCNNTADAWPIIQQNGISLNHYSGVWEASWEYEAAVGAFGTDEEVTGSFADKNPLRAAMVVYLMMQEDK